MDTCLEVRQLGKRYRGRWVLREVSFAVRTGEILGIIGPNGAGKSTLFHLISGVTPPSQGTVWFEGQDVTAWPPHRLCRAGMARTFQIPRIFPDMTVAENVRLGLWFGKEEALREKDQEERLQELLELVGLTEKSRTRAGELSLARQRLLEVARALATRPRLLLWDEIAAGLSAKAVEHLTSLALSLPERGVTLLITDHLLHLVLPVSHRLLALDQGEVIALGAPQDVINHPEVISAYLGERPEKTAGAVNP
uniref:ABC transporter ATP-binding protein n=1 Tax=Desulfobacca acetoxidans TaxID=60893 RepID=A0A7V4G8J3_9BACT